MPVYRYQALNAAGKAVKGQLDAESAKHAKAKLKSDKLLVTDITEISKSKPAKSDSSNAKPNAKSRLVNLRGRLAQSLQSISIQELSMFTRQLAVLLRAGIPLVETLSVMLEQTEKEGLQQTLGQIRDDVNEGSSLADALARHPSVFNSLYVNMVRAGESSGTLEIVLMRLADFQEGQAALKNKVVGALAYPAIIMLVMIAAMIFLVYFVIPNMLRVFEQTDMELPIYTQLLIFGVHFMRNYWWLLLGVIIAVVSAFRRWIATDKGRYDFDQFKLRVPGIRRLVLFVAIARFSRTLGTLLKSGVDMVTSLRIVNAVVGNEIIKEIVAETERAVTEGASLAQPLKASGVFPSTVTHMIAAGEKSGELEDMLLRVAETYERQVESYTVIMTSWLEPMIIIMMTGMVGFILASVLLPMMQMNEVL